VVKQDETLKLRRVRTFPHKQVASSQGKQGRLGHLQKSLPKILSATRLGVVMSVRLKIKRSSAGDLDALSATCRLSSGGLLYGRGVVLCVFVERVSLRTGINLAFYTAFPRSTSEKVWDLSGTDPIRQKGQSLNLLCGKGGGGRGDNV